MYYACIISYLQATVMLSVKRISSRWLMLKSQLRYRTGLQEEVFSLTTVTCCTDFLHITRSVYIVAFYVLFIFLTYFVVFYHSL